MKSLTAVVVVTLLLAAACTRNPASNACSNLQSLQIEQGRVVKAYEVSEGRDYSFKSLAMRVAAGIPLFDLPASCRVELELTPSADSRIQAQVWMPVVGWNEKFQGIGNGGFAGSVDTLSLMNALSQGYAAASTDTGHEAKDQDGSWALNHPEKALDYFSRAIHETAVASKRVIAAYYGRGPKYSYFGSASNGGRQALLQAQRYPDDYIGIVAGAPALSPTTGLTTWGWIQQQLHKPGAYISPDKLPAIAAATVAACDKQDGIADGVIDDPRTCQFDPAAMLCKGEESDGCLTAPQVEGLRAIYSGPGGEGPGGTYHGFFPGAELGKTSWGDWFTGSKPKTSLHYVYVQEFVRNLVYDDPTWSADNFDLKRDEVAIFERLKAMDAVDPDLSRFAARGGKLILWHGWNDPALPPQTTLDYYESVLAQMGPEQAAGFVKLYMIPGLQHGFGGPAPNVFGQLPPSGGDPSHSIAATLEAWVEQGREPSSIIATKYDNDFAPLVAPQSAKPLRTRPICPYPQVARWTGSGSTDDAANFRCTRQGS